MKHKRSLTKLGFLFSLCLALLLVLPGMSVKAEDVERYSTRVSYTNPLYAEDIPENRVHTKAPVYYSTGEIEYQETMQAAAAVVRDRLEERAETFTVGVKCDEWSDGVAYELFYEALEHTGEPTEGDYIKFTYGDWSADQNGYPDETGCYITITYTVWYYTTAEQEAEMDIAVEALLAELDLDEADDYTKVRGIYDYLCANITYDYDNLNDNSYWLKYTSYAALINKTAVCQGYASLFYRLALELGVDARVVPGYAGEAHAWNIVKIGDVYYNLDATWDAGKSSYSYFLQNQKGFDDHIRHELYDDEAFHAAYPMSEFDYGSDTAKEYVVAVYHDGKMIGKCESYSEAFALVTDENGEYRFEFITGKDVYLPEGEWPKAKLLEFAYEGNEPDAAFSQLVVVYLTGDVYLNSDIGFKYTSINCPEEAYSEDNKPTLHARTYTMYFNGINEIGSVTKVVSESEYYNMGICIDGPEATLVTDDTGHFKMFDLDIVLGTAYMNSMLIHQGGSFTCETLTFSDKVTQMSLVSFSGAVVLDVENMIVEAETFSVHSDYPHEDNAYRIGNLKQKEGYVAPVAFFTSIGTGKKMPTTYTIEKFDEIQFIVNFYDASGYTMEELEALCEKAQNEVDGSAKYNFYYDFIVAKRNAERWPAAETESLVTYEDLLDYQGKLLNIGTSDVAKVWVSFDIRKEYEKGMSYRLDDYLGVDADGNVSRVKDEAVVIENGVLEKAKFFNQEEKIFVVPESVVLLSENAFFGSVFKKLVLPDTIKFQQIISPFHGARIKEIEINLNGVFDSFLSGLVECDKLTFGPTVDYIGSSVLSFCTDLGAVYILNPEVEFANAAFANMQTKTPVTIYGYAGSTAEAYVKSYGEQFGLKFADLSGAGTPPSEEENEDCFYNGEYYALANEDVAVALNNDPDKLYEHWLNFGKAEGRSASLVFDAKYYLEVNQDVAASVGNDYEAAYEHFVNYGLAEGRESSPVFDVKYYLEANSDVAEAFNNDYVKAANHFNTNALAEGRSGSGNFDYTVYRYCNTDVADLYGEEIRGYYIHYINHGRAEGRTAGFGTEEDVAIDTNAVSYRIFDKDFYLENYPELASTVGTTEEELYRYWLSDGIALGHVASPVFDPEEYLTINTDVAGAVGSDLAAATNHFLNYGIYEGRTGVWAFDYTVYKYCNTDVVEVFGEDIVGYYFHYVKYGRAEGRTAKLQ